MAQEKEKTVLSDGFAKATKGGFGQYVSQEQLTDILTTKVLAYSLDCGITLSRDNVSAYVIAQLADINALREKYTSPVAMRFQ
ncbi:MAG: hypothetical protein RSD88_01995 [Anaerovoracaceae bacterium]